MLNSIKRTLKSNIPSLVKLHRWLRKCHINWKAFEVPIDKLLRGGENGIRSAKYAEITADFLRPSSLAIDSSHVKLLQLYDEIGDEIFKPHVFEQTDYYQNAHKCMNVAGQYFYDEPVKIILVAERFIEQYKGMSVDHLQNHPGQSAGGPVLVRPVKNSSYYEVIDGHHRIALAYMQGKKNVTVLIYDKGDVFTPLQQLLLDVLWINKKKWLYQPVESPEIKEQWILVRNCYDRLEMMLNFLQKQQLLPQNNNVPSYLDIGSSYGFFVSQMLQRGFNACGLERDIIAISVGQHVYGLPQDSCYNSDIIEFLNTHECQYEVVSCLSVLHHYVLKKQSVSAEEFMQLLDKITGKVLFLETAENHEPEFKNLLPLWSVDYIVDWIKDNSSFTKVIPLGKDNDRKKPFEGYYGRTTFACIRD